MWATATELGDDSELAIIVPKQGQKQVKLCVYTCRAAKAAPYTFHLHAENREGIPDVLKIEASTTLGLRYYH